MIPALGVVLRASVVDVCGFAGLLSLEFRDSRWACGLEGGGLHVHVCRVQGRQFRVDQRPMVR